MSAPAKLIWKGEFFAVQHSPGGKYWAGLGSQAYGKSEHAIVDLRKRGGGSVYGLPPRELNAPKAIEGRASPADVAALIAWAKKADAAEPKRLAEIKARELDFQCAAGNAIGAVMAALDKRGRTELEGGLSSNGRDDALSARAHLYLTNGVVVYLALKYVRGAAEAVVEILTWKHPRIEDAELESKLDFLATLPG